MILYPGLRIATMAEPEIFVMDGTIEYHVKKSASFAEVPPPMSRKDKCCKMAKSPENILVALIIASVCAGVGLGLGLHGIITTKRNIMYVAFVGDIFLRTLKALILPLIVASLVTGLASLDAKLSGKIGRVTVLYYFCTTVIAVFLGIGMVYIIQPGTVGQEDEIQREGEEIPATLTDTFLDLVR